MDSYADIPYDSTPFAETHPDHLAALGRLFGLSTPDPAGCRVLELGAASGGNLIPMAYYLPEAEFIGVDLSAHQVAEGRVLIERLGLTNVRLLAADVLTVGAELGRFDYIIAHGLYSWVPEAVREKILVLCGELLTPQGVAYISFNTLPGWRMRGMLRDMLLYHTRGTQVPRERLSQGYALLDLLEEGLGGLDTLSAQYLKKELASLRSSHPSYFYHEYLEDINRPFLFTDFLADARRHGLQYMCDVELQTMFPSALGAQAEAALAQIDDPLQAEQYLDFLRNRNFRRTLLCRADLTFEREIDLGALDRLALYAQLTVPRKLDLTRAKAQEFRGPDEVTYAVSHPLTKAALAHLAEVYPSAVPGPELTAEAQRRLARAGSGRYAAEVGDLEGELFSLIAHQAVRLSTQATRWPLPLRQTPCANRLARAQAAAGLDHVASPRHNTVHLDPFAARLVTLLDGSRTQAELVERLLADIREGGLPLPDAGLAGNAAKLQAAVTANTQRLIEVLAGQGLLAEGVDEA